MILVDVPQVTYAKEIEDLARVFYPSERVRRLKDSDICSSSDYILRCIYTIIDVTCISFIGQLEDAGGTIKEYGMRASLNSKLDNNTHQREIKNGIKGCVYDLLANITGIKPKWGILTGIRPVKLVNQLKRTGKNDFLIQKDLVETYRLNIEKAELLLRVAHVQEPYLLKDRGGTASLYIHIPFCSTRCHYCSFPSDLISRVSNRINDYLDCLQSELLATLELFHEKGITIDTVYIGGGTPTVLDHDDLERLLYIIDSSLNILPGKRILEYTVEAGRPDSLNGDKLLLLKDYGVNRLSINPQSMNQKTLDLIGRSHSVEDIINIYHEARRVGFDIINMDVIIGLPGESKEDFSYTMGEIGQLMPENITMHTLAIKRASSLKWNFKQYDPARDGLAEGMGRVCTSWMEKMGMNPYYLYRQKYTLDHMENIGYSLPGKECLYNMHIMEEKRSIWAFGAGAATKVYYHDEDRLERVANVKNLKDYVGRIDEMIDKKQKALVEY
ncbi:MAG TPA: coproporphyrinogen dehydrogenase HemZ [Bacillota bacterium]|nr:coproporphyrinogen dehydrogenase HemZ [Bacillota bacterium]